MPPHPYTTKLLQTWRTNELLRQAAESRMIGDATADRRLARPVFAVRAFVCGIFTAFSAASPRVRSSRRLTTFVRG
jgi:hypothetical protein